MRKKRSRTKLLLTGLGICLFCFMATIPLYAVLKNRNKGTKSYIESLYCPPSKDPGSGPLCYVDPSDCRQFYHCSYGKLILLECPEGLLFCSEFIACASPLEEACTFGDCIVKED